VADPAVATCYSRPGDVIDQLANRHRRRYRFTDKDVSVLFWSALNANGVDVNLVDALATKRHAGTWFTEFATQLVDPANSTPEAEGRQAMWACETVFARRGIAENPSERYQAADTAVSALQKETYRELTRWSPTPFPSPEAVLTATEVGIEYRDTNRLIFANPDYHDPAKYVSMLVSGELITVHVRLIRSDGLRGDFRTPSCTPANHVGASRVASRASQQMRLLTEGLGDRRPFAKDVLANLRAAQPNGEGLRLRNGLDVPDQALHQ
jgi:hypothetical protein